MARYQVLKQHDDVTKNPVYVENMLHNYKPDISTDEIFLDTKHIITTFISELNEHIVTIDGHGRFVGKVEEIGSTAEGVYTSTSDLDYLIVLKNSHMWLTEPADIRRIIPLSNKPKNISENQVFQRSTFDVTFNNSNPDPWEKFMCCDECRKNDTECSMAHTSRSLRAESVQEEYRRLLNEVIHEGIIWKDITINDMRKRGPAVTLDITYKEVNVSVDVTIAFEVPKTSPCWPLDIEDFRLRDDVRDHVGVCHLVAAGDYWKLSFAVAERNMMSAKQKKQLRVMKHIRDKELAKITSYALKTATLKGTSEDREHSSVADTISSTVIEMVAESTTTGQSSAFIEGVEVTPRDDSTYPEPWRILDHLHKLRSVCYREGVIHTLLWSLILGLVSSLFMGVLYMATLSQPGDCLVFSDVFSISVTLHKKCLSLPEIVEKGPCYNFYNQSMHEVDIYSGMFTYGYPWNTSNINHLLVNQSHTYCEGKSTQIDCITKCLRFKYMCDVERNMALCKRAFMLLFIICTYPIVAVCIVGIARTRVTRDAERVTLYKTYKGLRHCYIPVLAVTDVWAALTTVMFLQSIEWSAILILISFSLLCLLWSGMVLYFTILVICVMGIERALAKIMYFAIIFSCCYGLLYTIYVILNNGETETTEPSVDTFNAKVVFLKHTCIVPLYYIIYVGNEYGSKCLAAVIKLYVILWVAVAISPASVTVLWTSGTLLLFGCVHIVLSCVRGEERPKTYPHRTVHNQSYWCFQPVFAKFGSLYCSDHNWTKYIIITDNKVNWLLCVCMQIIGILLVIVVTLVLIGVLCFASYITFFSVISTACTTNYMAFPYTLVPILIPISCFLVMITRLFLCGS